MRQFFFNYDKDSMTYNLIISSVGSGHPDQYSYQILHENLSVWKNVPEKIIPTKRWTISLIAYVVIFFRTALVLEKPHFFTFLQSNYFNATVTFWDQLFLQRTYFLCWAPFPNSRFFVAVIFFRIATFSEGSFYRAANSRE